MPQFTERLQELSFEETQVSAWGDFLSLGVWHSGHGLLSIKHPTAQRTEEMGTCLSPGHSSGITNTQSPKLIDRPAHRLRNQTHLQQTAQKD